MNATKKRLDYINQLVEEQNKLEQQMSEKNTLAIKSSEEGDNELWHKLNDEWCELYGKRTNLEKKIERLVKKFLDDFGFELKSKFEYFYQVEDAVRYLNDQFENAMKAFHTIYTFNDIYKNK